MELGFIGPKWIRFDIITLEHQNLTCFLSTSLCLAVNKTKIFVYAVASYNLENYKMRRMSVTQTTPTDHREELPSAEHKRVPVWQPASQHAHSPRRMWGTPFLGLLFSSLPSSSPRDHPFTRGSYQAGNRHRHSMLQGTFLDHKELGYMTPNSLHPHPHLPPAPGWRRMGLAHKVWPTFILPKYLSMFCQGWEPDCFLLEI